MRRGLHVVLMVLAVALVPCAHAQISLTTAVDLAVRSSAKVKTSRDEVEKADAGLAQARDVFIPAVYGGAGLGDAFGYSTNPPTLFTVTAQSVVYSSAQFDYIRAARSSLKAANLALKDVEEGVAEDAALTFAAIEHDQEREAALAQEAEFSQRLVAIVEDRYGAGRDSEMDVVQAKLGAANLRLARLHQTTQTAIDREHLARMTGLPAASLQVAGGIPPANSIMLPTIGDGPMAPSVAAAYATAHAKQELAFGDNRFLYRPQVNLFVQYSRYATFASSFKDIETLYSVNNPNGKIGANEEAFGVQITLPVLDRMRTAKGRESTAEAHRAYHDAQNAEFLVLDGRAKLRHSLEELQVKTEVADLEQQYAQLQLNALLQQLKAPSGSGPQLTPKDEENSRINEREKYLSVIDATYTLREAQINLLRQTGQLGEWLKTATSATPAMAP